jgi:hypothetical protein
MRGLDVRLPVGGHIAHPMVIREDDKQVGTGCTTRWQKRQPAAQHHAKPQGSAPADHKPHETQDQESREKPIGHQTPRVSSCRVTASAHPRFAAGLAGLGCRTCPTRGTPPSPTTLRALSAANPPIPMTHVGLKALITALK